MAKLVVVACLLLVLSLWRYYRKEKVGGRSKFSRLPAKWWEFLRIGLIVLIFLLGGLAWKGVKLTKTKIYPEKEGAIVCFVADITYSMQAPLKKGSSISRMDAMLEVMNEVFNMFEAQKEQDNRVTVVAFGWDAWRLTLYPTNDFRLLRREVLSAINLYSSLEYGRKGSNLGAALIEGVFSFPEEEPGAKPRKKILIAITDGEPYGNQSKIQEQISQALAEYGQMADISFYLVPVGDPRQEVPIPKFDWEGNVVGIERDSTGRPITTKTDSTFLEEIAARTGGTVIYGGLESVARLKKEIKEAISNARKTGRMIKKTEELNLSFYFAIVFVLLLGLFFFKFRN